MLTSVIVVQSQHPNRALTFPHTCSIVSPPTAINTKIQQHCPPLCFFYVTSQRPTTSMCHDMAVSHSIAVAISHITVFAVEKQLPKARRGEYHSVEKLLKTQVINSCGLNSSGPDFLYKIFSQNWLASLEQTDMTQMNSALELCCFILSKDYMKACYKPSFDPSNWSCELFCRSQPLMWATENAALI